MNPLHRRPHYFVGGLLATILSLLSLDAAHGQVLWTLNGTIQSISSSYWDNTVSIGTPFTVTLSYTASGSATGNPAPERLSYHPTGMTSTIQFGDYTFTTSTSAFSAISVDQGLGGPPGYGYDWQVDAPTPAQNGLYDYDAQGFLLSSNASLLSSTTLPPEVFSVSNFDVQNNFVLEGNTTQGNYSTLQSVGGVVTSYSVVAAPEPSTWALLLGGISVLVYSQRRRCELEGELGRDSARLIQPF